MPRTGGPEPAAGGIIEMIGNTLNMGSATPIEKGERARLALRHLVCLLACVALLLACVGASQWHWHWAWSVVPALLVAIGVHDLLQRRHAVLRNYPIIGPLRYMIETVRPEIQ